jgi:hypothetical protein
VAEANVPAAQSVAQASAPTPVLQLPFAHGVHADAPAEGEYVPAIQLRHVVVVAA